MKNLIWTLFFKDDPDFVASKIDWDEKFIEYRDRNDALILENTNLKNTVSNAFQMMLDKDKEIEGLRALTDTDPLQDQWDNKYGKTIILYPGRSLPHSTTVCDAPVNVLITPTDPLIKRDLKDWKMIGGRNADWETLIPKIYNKIRTKYYHYEYDQNLWGYKEVWELPFELREKAQSDYLKADCDSWAIFQVSYYLAAGLPSWRVRVVAGMCELGGHATVYVFSKEDNKWHHLNSTYGNAFTKISEYPLHKDAEEGRDKLGIKQVWFSFNDKWAWAQFADDVPAGLKVVNNGKTRR